MWVVLDAGCCWIMLGSSWDPEARSSQIKCDSVRGSDFFFILIFFYLFVVMGHLRQRWSTLLLGPHWNVVNPQGCHKVAGQVTLGGHLGRYHSKVPPTSVRTRGEWVDWLVSCFGWMVGTILYTVLFSIRICT